MARVAEPLTPPEYRERFADFRLSTLLRDAPAVLINGPRACGKTTTARQHAASVVRLDQPAQAAAFKADPDAALRGREEPILLDEWQEVPGVLGAVKRAVDDDPRPGRFILTGSVRTDQENEMWPGTGRLIRLRMYGFTERELRPEGPRNHEPGFLDRLTSNNLAGFQPPPQPPDLRDYIDRAVRGGFPAVALASRSDPANWIDSYVEQLLTRDSHQVTKGRDEFKLARYFEVVAACSAGIPEHKTMYDAAGISRPTADVYDSLLADLFIAEQVPAWSDNRLTTLIRAPKRYVVDSSLMAAALDATTDTILGDSDLLGRCIDTFVAAQLRGELATAGGRGRVLHARTKGGREEIDIVVERPGRKVLALEMKASAAPSRADAKHLRWLRDQLGDRFVAGAVMHTGPDAFQLDDRIHALPIWAFWA